MRVFAYIMRKSTRHYQFHKTNKGAKDWPLDTRLVYQISQKRFAALDFCDRPANGLERSLRRKSECWGEEFSVYTSVIIPAIASLIDFIQANHRIN